MGDSKKVKREIISELAKSRSIGEMEKRLPGAFDSDVVQNQIRDRLKSMIESIMENGVVAELIRLIQTSQFSKQELSQLRPTIEFYLILNESIQEAIQQLIDHLDYVDSIDYYSHLLHGIENGIASAYKLFPISQLAYRIWQFFSMTKLSDYDLIHFITMQVWLYLQSQVELENISTISIQTRKGGKKKKVDKLVKRDKIPSSIDSFMVKPTHKSGKAVFNRWKKMTEQKSWTIGFSR